MKKTIVLLAALLQSAIVCAQNVVPLASPSKSLQAEISVQGQSVQIGLYDKGNKVVEMKTLQLDLEEDYLKGDWQLVDQTRETVDQSWQPVYGERSLVTNRYNGLELLLRSAENQKEMMLFVRLYDEGLAFRYAFNEKECQVRHFLRV